MDVHKINVKFFLEDAAAVDTEAVIPLFHRWIQTHRVPGILVDVADYTHVPNSTGVALIGHEADWYLDSSEGPAGLMYGRKQPFEGAEAVDLAARLRAAFKAALTACAKFEEDYQAGAARAKFRPGEAVVIFNDRLNAPNTDAAYAAIEPALAAVAAKVYNTQKVAVHREGKDARQRLTVRVLVPSATEGSVAELVKALA